MLWALKRQACVCMFVSVLLEAINCAAIQNGYAASAQANGCVWTCAYAFWWKLAMPVVSTVKTWGQYTLAGDERCLLSSCSVCVCVCVCVCLCLLRCRLSWVNGSHGTLHGHNYGRCELQNGAKLDLLGNRLDHLGSIFGCSGRSVEVSGQCFGPSQQTLRCGGQFWGEFSQILTQFGPQNDAKSQSWHTSNNEVALGTDLDDLFKEFGLEKKVLWDTNLYMCWVWCEVHDNLQYSSKLL